MPNTKQRKRPVLHRRELFMPGLDYLDTTATRPALDADQTSSYILPMFVCIMTKPDKARIAHYDGQSKHLDLILKNKGKTDISFGVVLLT